MYNFISFTHMYFNIYSYMYIYVCVSGCVCACVCAWGLTPTPKGHLSAAARYRFLILGTLGSV